ncbi:MAG: CPBP family intramembrane glutamic endopeptidase [Motilibacteraceae bacterium]
MGEEPPQRPDPWVPPTGWSPQQPPPRAFPAPGQPPPPPAPAWGPPTWPPPGAVPWGGPPVVPPAAGTDRPYARAPHREPEPYPRLLRTSRWRWWRPVLGLLLGVAVLALLGVGVVVAVGLVEALRTGSAPTEGALADFSDPLVLLANNLLLAALIPATLLAVLVVHRERPGWLCSVVGRLRWGLLWRFTLLAAGTTVLGAALGSLLPGLDAATDGGTVDGGRLTAQLAVIVLTTPLQAAGEEFGFRGYLTQALAGYGRSRLAGPLVAGLVTSLLFALAHGGQAPLLFADRFAFGALAAWLVWRTGGLEASIALHSVNNLLALGAAALSGALSQSITGTDLPWQAFVVDVGSLLLFALLADRWARRRGAARLSAPAPATLEVAPPIG